MIESGEFPESSSALALVVGGVVWALWPATTWHRSFCAPVERTLLADPREITVIMNHDGIQMIAASPRAQAAVATLRADIILAQSHAPTVQLRAEFGVYLSQVRAARSQQALTDAESQFFLKVNFQAPTLEEHPQLAACGIKPGWPRA